MPIPLQRARRRLPEWLRVDINRGTKRRDVDQLIADLRLHTVCQSAQCPNQAECWHAGAATFMILGDNCTRQCAFCAVGSDSPDAVDPFEPTRIAEAAQRLRLDFVVVTSVDRDDLPDKGAGHFVRTIAALRRRLPSIGIEVLTPDFAGRPEPLEAVIAAAPTVFNHNLETCERLTPPIRSGARYRRSLTVLRRARDLADGRTAIKSGIMVGMGETDAEVAQTIHDLRDHGVQILTIGQYLPPTRQHWPLQRYVEPRQFAAWAKLARRLGIAAVASGPKVRSSYRAEQLAQRILGASSAIPRKISKMRLASTETAPTLPTDSANPVRET